MSANDPGRPNQRRRTRKDLLQAAARLMKQDRIPSLEEIATEALVSRATAYRYFPNVESLLAEVPLDLAVPEPAQLFRNKPASDPVARLEHVDQVLHDVIKSNETSFRMMLAYSLQRPLDQNNSKLPVRQNRRTPLIDAALEPVRHQIKPATLKTLSQALALIIGPEATVVFKDVLRTDEAQARKVRRWAIGALFAAARDA